MNKHLSVRQTLDRLERLRVAVTQLTAQARQIEADAQLRRSLESRRFDALVAGEQGRLESELQAADAQHQAAQTVLEGWVTQRRQRLQKARRGARRDMLDRIELEEGRHKYAVQKGILEAERTEKEGLEANDARQHESTARQAQQQEKLASTEATATNAFRGYRSFRRALMRTPPATPSETAQDESQLFDAEEQLVRAAETELQKFRKLVMPRFFRFVPLWLAVGVAAVAGAGAVWLPPRLGTTGLNQTQALGLFSAVVVVLVLLFVLGKKNGAALAATVAGALGRARLLLTLAQEKAATRHAEEYRRITSEAQARRTTLTEHWHQSVAEAGQRRDLWPQLEAEKADRAAGRWEILAGSRRTRLEHSREAGRKAIEAAAAARRQPQVEEHERREAQINAEQSARWDALQAERTQRVDPLLAELHAAREAAGQDFPAWTPELWRTWRPPGQFGDAAQFGWLSVDLAGLSGGSPQDVQRALPGPPQLTLPLLLTYPDAGSLLIETGKTGSETAADTLNQVLLRLLAATPPGKLNFTLIDPVRLGQSFAGVMHLTDFEENLINRRIWTQPAEIEQQLADLSGHMEKVIQMYLRNEYATIAEYNAQAGNIAEKYHFLVLADFPANFSEVALRRLVNIATSGARCGVYTLVHWDHRQAAPPEFVVEALRQNSVVLTNTGGDFTLGGAPLHGVKVQLEAAPTPELTTDFLRLVGASGKNTGQVRVPFSQVAPEESEVWSLTTTEELRVPIGRTGATKLQYLALGKGTRQHALVAGKTGSGKSTLFHVIITNLALWCSPEQVEFYLVDFKKGVEFKCYGAQHLPHARVVAIESDREFGLSVLQKLDDELRRRGDQFRQLGVQDLAGYQRVTGGQVMPRALLLIDEFQEFFVEDDRVSQTAAVLLDRIVRQGRAFGIHVVLGSQTLGGAYTLARTTLGQMVVRIALQCNEADAFLIMDDTNPAPRLLTRPGEGIYNDMAGMVEGNSPFQTVWLADEERDTLLAGVRRHAEQAGQGELSPFVFEGNAPALVRDNAELRLALASPPVQPPAGARLWLGAPNSIKGPTVAELRPQSANHLLLVGQREDAELAILGVSLLGLAAQFPPGGARFILLESTAPGSSQQAYLRQVVEALPEPAVVGRAGELPAIFSELSAELKRRSEGSAAALPTTFVFIHGLQNFKKLMPEDEFGFSSGAGSGEEVTSNVLKDLLTAGPAVGLHVILTCDTYNNLNRYLGRKGLGNFGMRVLFQMSANDSSSLIDNPKANTLGMYRALLHNEQEGWLETFRPYALPDRDWIREVKAALAAR